MPTAQEKLEQIEVKSLTGDETFKYQILTQEDRSHREAMNVIIADRLESNK